MSQTLVLDSLNIRNFRGLRELNVQRLGRANLITGKNNVGKTSVLEALRLYAKPGDPGVLMGVLAARDELKVHAAKLPRGRESLPVPIENLFHCRQMKIGGTDRDRIHIGPLDNPLRVLSIGIELANDPRTYDTVQTSLFGEPYVLEETIGRLRIAFRMGSSSILLPFGEPSELTRFQRAVALRAGESAMPTTPNSFVKANGLSAAQIGKLWDSIALTDLEDEVNSSLRIIADIERLSLVALDRYSQNRTVVARVSGSASPVALRSLGDGLNRLFGLILAMVNARGGLFLIDEIENGLHYSIQPDVWRAIFRIAEQLDVQVFATTHSSDCVKAFEIAARESPEDGVLIRLSQKGDQTLVGEFDEEELGIAVEGNIEVR